VCDGRIKTELEAHGCVACDVAVHSDVCVEDGLCPSCGADMEATARAAEDADYVEEQLGMARGRVMAMAALQTLAVLAVLVLVVDAAMGDPTRLIRALIRTPLTLGLLYMVYRGKEWARVLTIFLCVAASTVGGLALLGQLGVAGTVELVASGLVTLVPLVCGLVLLSPHVKVFLHLQANPSLRR